jgi:hypothetical protein
MSYPQLQWPVILLACLHANVVYILSAQTLEYMETLKVYMKIIDRGSLEDLGWSTASQTTWPTRQASTCALSSAFEIASAAHRLPQQGHTTAACCCALSAPPSLSPAAGAPDARSTHSLVLGVLPPAPAMLLPGNSPGPSSSMITHSRSLTPFAESGALSSVVAGMTVLPAQPWSWWCFSFFGAAVALASSADAPGLASTSSASAPGSELPCSRRSAASASSRLRCSGVPPRPRTAFLLDLLPCCVPVSRDPDGWMMRSKKSVICTVPAATLEGMSLLQCF